MTAVIERPLIAAKAATKKLTVKQFLALDEIDGDENFYENYELINGEIVAKTKKKGPSGRHGEVINNLGSELRNFVKADKLGRVFVTSPCAFSENNYYIPDVAFVARGRITVLDFEGTVPVIPDLVAEVNSPSDTIEQIHNKIEVYLKAGVQLIWSINLVDKYIFVYQAGEPERTYLSLKDELDGGAVLPNFKLKVADLFVGE